MKPLALHLLSAPVVETSSSAPAFELQRDTAEGYKVDPDYPSILPTRQRLMFLDGLWWYNDRIAAPDVHSLKQHLMQEFHDSTYAGHLGVNRTLHSMEQYLWWPNMDKSIGQFISTCISCQRNKNLSTKPAGLLQPLDVPDRPWGSVSTDFITGLPVTKSGFDAIAVFVDRLTKYVHIVPTPTKCTAWMWTDFFVIHVFGNHGMVDEVISNRGPQFAGNFNQHLAERLNIKWKLSTAYHPQTDGQTERTNRTIEDMLQHFVSPATDDWDRYLAEIHFAINNAWQESVRSTPFYLNYGYHPKTPLAASLPKGKELTSKNPVSTKYSWHMQQVLAKAKRCMLDAQQRQKRYYDLCAGGS